MDSSLVIKSGVKTGGAIEGLNAVHAGIAETLKPDGATLDRIEFIAADTLAIGKVAAIQRITVASVFHFFQFHAFHFAPPLAFWMADSALEMHALASVGRNTRQSSKAASKSGAARIKCPFALAEFLSISDTFPLTKATGSQF